MRWLCLITLLLLPFTGARAQDSNAGIVQGLWYSHEPIFVDQTVRIYAAVRNNTGADLSARVEFFANGELIERTSISALNNRIVETWADWQPTYGEHEITVNLSRTELSQVGSTTKEVEVVSALAEDVLFVDLDTDNDGIGDKEDSDDDGDGISDNKEKAAGTDPLDKNDPGEEAEESSEEEAGGSEAPARTDPSAEPAGLEQYLTDGQADETLSSVTKKINETKRRLDAYRENRNNQHEQENTPYTDNVLADSLRESASSSPILTTDPLLPSTDPAGFGAVTRSHADEDAGWFAKLTNMLGQLLSSLYTFVLFLLSQYLAHPIFVQLTFLILILFILIKFARKLARRPQ